MTKILSICVALVLLTGCDDPPPESTARAGNGYSLERLFTNDGCAVYYFSHNGRSHYYTDCRGGVSTTQSCGKNCSYEENVETNL